MAQRLWTREEAIIVFNLYCKIPFRQSSKNHPEVIRIANLIGRSPSAVNMKIGNFGSFDATLRERGIVGLTNASKLDAQIWAESIIVGTNWLSKANALSPRCKGKFICPSVARSLLLLAAV